MKSDLSGWLDTTASPEETIASLESRITEYERWDAIETAERGRLLQRIAELQNEAECLLRERDNAEKRITELDANHYVPGLWKCTECQYVVQMKLLIASTGNVAVNKKEVIEPCPNDGYFLRRVTYKEEYEALYEAYVDKVNEFAQFKESSTS
ncbi:MAG: hypothetical protein U0Y68_27200 [Blastocatellia bacterium]